MVKLIINADDFGMSNAFNDCIIQLLIDKKITSTTVMVNRIADSQKVKIQHLRYLLENNDISVGLHVEFTYNLHLEQVYDQYHKFINIFGKSPSHLDIHKEHLHRNYHPIVADFCLKNDLPLRNHGKNYKGVNMPLKKYFYGSVEDFEPIDNWLKSLDNDKCFELVFHPGKYDPNCFSSLNRQREWDIGHIHRICRNLEKYHIKLVNFNHLKKFQPVSKLTG